MWAAPFVGWGTQRRKGYKGERELSVFTHLSVCPDNGDVTGCLTPLPPCLPLPLDLTVKFPVK